MRTNASNGAEATSWVSPPAVGTYNIDVDQYSTCGGSSASWTLQVIKAGTVVQTNTGTGSTTSHITYSYTGA